MDHHYGTIVSHHFVGDESEYDIMLPINPCEISTCQNKTGGQRWHLAGLDFVQGHF